MAEVKDLYKALGKLIDEGKGDYGIYNVHLFFDREGNYHVKDDCIDDRRKYVLLGYEEKR
jgi:hypothetical protein